MNLETYSVIEEYPMVTDSIEVKLSPDFFLEDKSDGSVKPIMETRSKIADNHNNVLLLQVNVSSYGKTVNGKKLYTIKYGVRVAFRFNKDLDPSVNDDPNFINFYAEKIYQRVADRIGHIGYDMGLIISMPMTRPEIIHHSRFN